MLSQEEIRTLIGAWDWSLVVLCAICLPGKRFLFSDRWPVYNDDDDDDDDEPATLAGQGDSLSVVTSPE